MLRNFSIFIIFSILFPLFTAAGALTKSNVAAEAEDNARLARLFFDFGNASSPVEDGYYQVTNTMIYTPERGYGISESVAERDRGGPDDLRRDFILANGFHFYVDVPNGDYHLKIIAGDTIAFNRTGITINGDEKGSISSSAGQFAEFTDIVTVEDGQMDVRLTNDGRINGLEIVPLSAPEELQVVEKTVYPDSSVTLSWQEVEGATSYNVYRKEDGEFQQIGNTKEPRFTDDTAELGLTYMYAVTQISEAKIESAKSSEVTVQMVDEAVAPAEPPTGLRLVKAAADRVELQWKAVDGAVKYYVYRAKYEHRSYELVGVTEDTAFTDDDVLTNIPFYYKVAAVNVGGLSEKSSAFQSPVTKVNIRQMEALTRSPVAVNVADGVYLGWRMLGTDPESVAFDIYRDGVKINAEPIKTSTNFLDPDGTEDAVYHIRALNVANQAKTEEFHVWSEQYLSIPLNKPEGGVTPDGVAYTYSANDASVGDLTGDGNYEIILKWDPSNSKDNSQSGYTGNVYIDAYKLDGTKLWRIDLGRNIRAGAHYTQFLVYDFDGNGKAEVVFKTADGTIDGEGRVIGDPDADYRNSAGYILEGPEFLTVFDGETGKALTTTDYYPPRGNVSDWGDGYGNRVDRFLAGVAYLDGERPSIVMARGYYTRTVLAAYNWRDGELTQEWVFDSNDPGNGGYAGQGNHSLAVADVDGDGKDEIIYGAMVVDHDGTGLYTTGWGHGDANHVSNLNPNRPGMEIYQVHESAGSPVGFGIRDAETGELLWGVRTGTDVGRGLAADIDPRYAGTELWASASWDGSSGGSGLYTVEGERITNTTPRSINHAVWWTGDLLRELLDHSFDPSTDPHGVGKIDKWNWETEQLETIFVPEGTRSNNWTKGNPSLQADLFGDWREEVIWPTADSTELRIYTTTDVTEHRIYTLMHDPVYRLSIAWQNVAYNQPPHTGFFLGHGMEAPPVPYIHSGEVVPVDVWVTPKTLHLKSSGGKNAFTVKLNVPAGVTVDAPTVKVNVNGTTVFADVSKNKQKGNQLTVKLHRQAVIDALDHHNGDIELTITGYSTTGTMLIGKDTVMVKR